MPVSPPSIGARLRHWMHLSGDAPAILAPGRAGLDRAELGHEIDRVGVALAAKGLAASDRVAVVLPNGPEAAVLSLGIASWATLAPLNPAGTTDEFKTYLELLGVRLLITEPAFGARAIVAATALGLPVLAVRLADDERSGTVDFVDLAAQGRPVGALPAGDAVVRVRLQHARRDASRDIRDRGLQVRFCRIRARPDWALPMFLEVWAERDAMAPHFERA